MAASGGEGAYIDGLPALVRGFGLCMSQDVSKNAITLFYYNASLFGLTAPGGGVETP